MSNGLKDSRSALARAARAFFLCLAAAGMFLSAAPALAKSTPAAERPEDRKPDPKSKDKKPADTRNQKDLKGAKDLKNQKDAKTQNGLGKSEQIGTFADWGAFATQGRDRTCYAMSQPTDRQPKAKLQDTLAYIFISARPGEGVRNEVAINLGYPTKDGASATAEVNNQPFELITKGTNAWLKNQDEEDKFVKVAKAAKGSSKLVIKATSLRGTATVDVYSLKGVTQALDRVFKECQ